MPGIMETTDAWWLVHEREEDPADAVVSAVTSIRNEASTRRGM